MIVTPLDRVIGKRVVQQLGLISESYVASRVFFKDFMAGIRSFLGLEVKEYTKMMQDARGRAISRMVKRAEQQGANAIVNVRFVTSATSLATAEIMCFGDAQKVE